MKYGMNLLLWTDHFTEEHLPLAATLKKTGFDGVELPLFTGDADHYKKIGRELKNLGLACHGVTVCGADNNPISPDASVRQKALDHHKWAIEMLGLMGGGHLSGPYHSAIGVFTGQGPTKDETQRAADVLRQSAEFASAHDITLTIEYLNRFECYLLTTAAQTKALVQAVDHPHFRCMYDTFHAHIEEKSAAAAIQSLADIVGHIHISENDRGTPGTGMVRWDETFQTLRDINYDGWLVIESFGRSLPALAAATKVWRDLFPSPEDVYTQGLRFMKSKTK